MQQQPWIGIFALSAACLLWPAAAPAQEPEPPTIVSSELMDLIEAWSDPPASVETIALSSRPDLIETYVAVAEGHHGGKPLAEVFAEKLPLTLAEFQMAIGGGEDEPGGGDPGIGDPDGGDPTVPEAPTAAQLVAFAMAGGSEEYFAWQTELATGGADFVGYVKDKYPEVVEEVEQTLSPAKQGIGLLDFAAESGSAELAEELTQLTRFWKWPLLCRCWTVVSFANQPTPWWGLEINESYSSQWGFLPVKRRKWSYSLGSRGAARYLNAWRRSEHTVYEELRDKSGNTSSMRIRMNCTDVYPFLRICPYIDTCKGELVARMGYASRVKEEHASGSWPFSHAARAATGDRAQLTYDSPGPGPVASLFSKGVAVGGATDGWSAYGILASFFAPLPLFEAPTWPYPVPLLSSLLWNPTANNFAGLISTKYSSGSFSTKMRATWENPSSPIVLLPNETHAFDLNTRSRIFGGGHGPWSETRNNLESADFMAAVERNYQCAPWASPPASRAYWNYGRSGSAPYSASDLHQLIQSFASPLLGYWVPNVPYAAPGQFP